MMKKTTKISYKNRLLSKKAKYIIALVSAPIIFLTANTSNSITINGMEIRKTEWENRKWV